MPEPAQKCENYAIIKQNYTLGLFLLFWLKGKSRFSRFPPKKFYNINSWFTLATGKERIICYRSCKWRRGKMMLTRTKG